MSDLNALVRAYERFVAIPWVPDLAPPQRVWMLVYPPSDERRIRARIAFFDLATVKANKVWYLHDLTNAFADWLNSHPYRETYFRRPELLSGSALRDFEKFLVAQIVDTARIALEDPDSVIALLGVGGLFPFTQVSKVIAGVAPFVAGRLVVFFPGEREGSNYRLLEARDGWNYLATPITATEEAS